MSLRGLAARGVAAPWAWGLLAVVVLIYAPVLPSDRTFWYRDIYGFWSALADAFVRVVASGAPPLWNPYLGFGMPMLADPGAQVLYPFTWLNLILGPALFYKAYAVCHAFGGGLGLQAFARRQGLAPLPAFVAALAWVASGPFQELLGHTHHFAGAAWLPWVLFALDRALTLRSLGSGLVLGAVAAGQVLAGSGDLCLMTTFIACGFMAYRLLSVPAGERSRALAVSVLVGAPFAALLSAAQWLPTLALLRSGMRLGMSSRGHTYWSLHPASLLELFVPNVLSGLPVSDALRASLYEAREPLYACLYLGAPALVLVAFGLGGPGGRLRHFAMAGFGLALLVALGRYTPAYELLARFTPLAILRYPTKYTIAAAFFWSLLVGWGADRWLADGGRAGRRRLATGVGGALTLALLASALAVAVEPEFVRGWLVNDPVARALAPAALAGRFVLTGALVALTTLCLARLPAASRLAWLPLFVLGADLLRVAQGINPGAPRSLLEYRPVTASLPANARVYVARAHPRDWLPKQVVRAPAGWARAWAVARSRTDLLWPPQAGRFGFRGSFDGDFTGLAAPLLSNLTLILSAAEGTPLATRLLQVAGVDYVVAADENPWPGFELEKQTAALLKQPIRVLRVPSARPAVFLVGRSRVATDPESIRILANAAFDPASEVVLESGPILGGPEPFAGELSEFSRSADHLEVVTTSNTPGLLVVLESHDPGWRASVDRVEVPILRADVLFKAVPVPSGRHRVELQYRPRSLTLGATLSALGLAIGGVVLGWGMRARRALVERAVSAL